MHHSALGAFACESGEDEGGVRLVEARQIEEVRIPAVAEIDAAVPMSNGVREEDADAGRAYLFL